MSAERDLLVARFNAASDPARLRIIDALLIHGPATATELGHIVENAPKTTMPHHLKTLAEVGHITADSGEGKSTVWRATPQQMIVPDDAGDDDELLDASVALEQALLRRRIAAQKAWSLVRHDYPEWADVASRDANLWATPEQAQQIEDAYAAAVAEVRKQPRHKDAVPLMATLTVTPRLPL